MSSSTSAYVGGDYEAFTDDAPKCTDDWYKVVGKIITFLGTKNYAGHKFYDKDGNLIWATSKRSDTLPDVVTKLGLANVTIMTANYDMTDTPCTDTQPETDAINDIRINENATNPTWRDLSGRPISRPTTKGIYILDRQKVVVK